MRKTKKTRTKKRKTRTVTTSSQSGRATLPHFSSRRRAQALLLCMALLFCASSLASGRDNEQNHNKEHEPPPYALIFGTVWSPDGRPIYGVPVSIRRADQKKAKWHLVSDRQGEFAQRVPAGKAEYVVWADIKMPKGESPPQVRVQVEKDERVDIGLHLTKDTPGLRK